MSMLALNRLGEGDGVALVERLAGNAGLSHEIVDEIVERADGVPLFVEELTKAVLESADRDNRVAAVLGASPLPNLAIPATLHASLIARLDRLGPVAKEVAQIGAVIGREFSYELIQPVAQRHRQHPARLDAPATGEASGREWREVDVPRACRRLIRCVCTTSQRHARHPRSRMFEKSALFSPPEVAVAYPRR